VKIDACRFVVSAFRAQDEPAAPGPDVVFIGRSNVGKSSLINRLLGVAGLARTSSTPGRTQSVNFYRVNESLWFVDLPGYGWAKVPEEIRRAWRPLVEGYLERRRTRIAAALLVVDARRDPTTSDLTMRDWLAAAGLPWLVVATKIDKLSQAERARSLAALAAAHGSAPLAEAPLAASARSGEGLRELWRRLDDALERHRSIAGAR
jgi:GTP-binding protein